ncbi:MAG TPA: RidA family protein [Candidatus Sulfotelmatobacter sp.]|nr:RidA family protein [Candidatus Sulfotelmatobacter sp.]
MSAAIEFLNPAGLAPPPGYSQVAAVRSGRLVYIAGQVALDAAGALVGAGDIDTQAGQVFRNLSTALAAVGGSAADLVKLTVFVRDMAGLAAYRAARDRFFASVAPPAAPAVTLVEVSRLYRDDALIEVEAVAAL